MTATDLFFDFVCPYAWRGMELAHVLRAEGETFRLRHFSLVQGNHPDNAGQPEPRWWLTDQPAGRAPFPSAAASRHFWPRVRRPARETRPPGRSLWRCCAFAMRTGSPWRRRP
ncbi:DsbA family protein [Deinococcus malanensis]|uniref:DsbA family protein n=1 Tax=Deinococcus malanensis TaxID=1706855 RepID=UPI00362C44FE